MNIHVTHEQTADFEEFLDRHGLALAVSEICPGAWCAQVPKAEYLWGLTDEHWVEMKGLCFTNPTQCVRMLVESLNISDRKFRKRGRFGLWKYFESPRLTLSAETLAKVEREVGR